MRNIEVMGLQYFVIIVDKNKKKKFMGLLDEYDARAIETVYSHGSMSPSAVIAAFGFESVESKVMISCLLKTDNAKKLIDVLYNEYNFKMPNTGIAFSVPVEGMAF